MHSVPLTSKSGEGYGILLEVCCTAHLRKGMIKVHVRVGFHFSHLTELNGQGGIWKDSN